MKFDNWKDNKSGGSWRDIISPRYLLGFSLIYAKLDGYFFIKVYNGPSKYIDKSKLNDITFNDIEDGKKYIDSLISKIEKLTIFE